MTYTRGLLASPRERKLTVAFFSSRAFLSCSEQSRVLYLVTDDYVDVSVLRHRLRAAPGGRAREVVLHIAMVISSTHAETESNPQRVTQRLNEVPGALFKHTLISQRFYLH